MSRWTMPASCNRCNSRSHFRQHVSGLLTRRRSDVAAVDPFGKRLAREKRHHDEGYSVDSASIVIVQI